MASIPVIKFPAERLFDIVKEQFEDDCHAELLAYIKQRWPDGVDVAVTFHELPSATIACNNRIH